MNKHLAIRLVGAGVVAYIALRALFVFATDQADPPDESVAGPDVVFQEPQPTPIAAVDAVAREAFVFQEPDPPAPAPTPTLAPASRPNVAAAAAQPVSVPQAPYVITLVQLDEAAALAGWDVQGPAWSSMRRIIVECECPSLNTRAHNGSDPAGGSHGLTQLNGTHWFTRYGEDFALRYDPVTNLRTARKLHEEFGRFGGPGLWSCADRLGIY